MSGAAYADAFTAAAVRDGWMLRHAWAPWARLADGAAWTWFAARLGLPGGWTLAGCVEPWAAEGLFPGVARVVVDRRGLVDPDSLCLAADDWPDAGAVIAGQPMVTLPLVSIGRAQCLDPRPSDIFYLPVTAYGSTGDVPARFGQAPAPAWIGRDPAAAVRGRAAWRVYPDALAWLAAALAGRDGFDDLDPDRWPGGGAILNLDRFIADFGERICLDFGRDATAANAYAARRKALLRPKRPALPDVISRDDRRVAV